MNCLEKLQQIRSNVIWGVENLTHAKFGKITYTNEVQDNIIFIITIPTL